MESEIGFILNSVIYCIHIIIYNIPLPNIFPYFMAIKLIEKDWDAAHPGGKNRKKQDDVGRSLGADGGGPTTKDSRGDETARP